MVGHISKKVRGVCAKFWAEKELFFNTAGLRFIPRKPRDSYAKEPG
jgi:hypothetical protein